MATPTRSRWGQTKPPLGTLLNQNHPLLLGLQGYWPGNEGGGPIALDLLYRNHGAFSSAVTWAGGGDWQFDAAGAGNPISIPANARYDTNIAAVSAWYWTVPGATTREILLSKDNPTGAQGLIIKVDGLSSRGISLALDGGNDVEIWGGSGVVVNDGLRHHVVACFNYTSGQTSLLYSDGRLVASAASSGPTTQAAQPIIFGRSQDTFWARWGGGIRNVAWWNRYPTAQEVWQLYTEPYVLFQPSAPKGLWLVNAIASAGFPRSQAIIT